MMNSKVYEIIDKYIANAYKALLNESDDNKVAAFESDRENELRILKVHYENSKQSGLNIIGIAELIHSLNEFKGDNVFIINFMNKKYFIKLYLDKGLNKFLGYTLIKLRKKTEEEIQWGRDVLGIKSLPPDIG